MAIIRSFHSAPHSLVQAAIAAALHDGQDEKGIAGANDTLQQATATLDTLTHPRDRERGAPQTVTAKLSTASPLGSTDPFSRTCLDLMLQYAWAMIRGNKADAEKYKQVFEKGSCDNVGWLSAAFDYIVSYDVELWKPISYIAAPPPEPNNTQFLYALPEQANVRIGILGDWGTGEQVAQYVVNAMMTLQPQPDLILHVGDVYYAGTPDEVKSNYIEIIQRARKATGCKAPIYNLPGNHDMYTKGAPFYGALAEINKGAEFLNSPSTPVLTQEASFFVLSNSWLHLQGMDTGFYDSDLFDVGNDTTMLHEAEAAWHVFQMNQAKNKSIFLFSHHQPWSGFLHIDSGPGVSGHFLEEAANRQPLCYNQNLRKQLASAPVGPVKAWFWGHEHVLEVYDQPSIAKSSVPLDPQALDPQQGPSTPLSSLFPWVPYGACIGYSAFPMLLTDEPYDHIYPSICYNTEYTLGTVPAADTEIYNHGFTMLDTSSDGSATATFYWLKGDGSSPQATPFPQPSVICGAPVAG